MKKLLFFILLSIPVLVFCVKDLVAEDSKGSEKQFQIGPAASLLEQLNKGSRDLNEPTELGDVIGNPKKKQVLIYYANETSIEGVGAKNVNKLGMWLRSSNDPKVRILATGIEADTVKFKDVVQQEIAALKKARSKLPASAQPAVVLVTNSLARYRKMEIAGAGKPFEEIPLKLPEMTDGILQAWPLADNQSLAAVLQAAANKFPTNEYEYILVTKSHGNTHFSLTTRVAFDTAILDRDRVISILETKAIERIRLKSKSANLDKDDGLQTKSKGDFLKSQAGKEFLKSNAGKEFLKSKDWGKFLGSKAGGEFLSSKAGGEFLSSKVGGEFLGSKAGGEFLSSKAGGEFLSSKAGGEFLSSKAGGEFLSSKAGGEFLNSKGGGEFLGSKAGGEFLSSKTGGEWLSSKSGGEFLESKTGGEFLNSKNGGEFLESKAGGEFLGSKAGGEFLSSKAGGEFLGSKGDIHPDPLGEFGKDKEGRPLVYYRGTTKKEFVKTILNAGKAGMDFPLLFAESCMSQVGLDRAVFSKSNVANIGYLWTSDLHGLRYTTVDYVQVFGKLEKGKRVSQAMSEVLQSERERQLQERIKENNKPKD